MCLARRERDWRYSTAAAASPSSISIRISRNLRPTIARKERPMKTRLPCWEASPSSAPTRLLTKSSTSRLREHLPELDRDRAEAECQLLYAGSVHLDITGLDRRHCRGDVEAAQIEPCARPRCLRHPSGLLRLQLHGRQDPARCATLAMRAGTPNSLRQTSARIAT